LLKTAYSDFVSSGEWVISQKLQGKEKSRAEEIKRIAQEAREEIAQRQQEDVKAKEKVVQQPTVIPSESAAVVSPTEEAPKTEPAKLEEVPTLSDILGGWLGEGAKAALETPSQAQE
jgi:hypothetical protein